MTDDTWRPLGVESEAEVAAYDSLRDGIPLGMETTYWEWVQAAFTMYVRYRDGSGQYKSIDADLAEHAAQALSVPMGTVRITRTHAYEAYKPNVSSVLTAMKRVEKSLSVADFLLAHRTSPDETGLDAMLKRSRSLWAIGTRAGHRGLVRRVPSVLLSQLDSVVHSAGSAGKKLGEAWDSLYGLAPTPSHAYTMAIRAVEDASIPLVVPKQDQATLGHVIGKMRSDGDWTLPFTRQRAESPAGGLPLAMCRSLWSGQHDRHGGVPTSPGQVSQDEAEAAVSLAISLVHWFSAGMVAREQSTS